MAKAISEAAVGALSILLLSLASSCVTLLCASATATALAGPPPLPRLVHLDTKAPVTVSGVSSGGAFAMQLHLAYSRGIVGAGLVAAPPYWCAQDSLQIALTACEKDASLISISVLEAEARFAQDTAGSIDRLSNLRGSRVWLLSGTRDTVVRQAVVNKTRELYARWVPPESIEYVASLASEHAWITDDYGSACSRLGSPFINNCKFDASGAMLRHLLGADAVNKSRVKRVPENFYRFDQSIYTPLHTPDLSSMSPSGYAYIPLVCRLNSSSSSSSSTAR